jgi:hypothetical protein
MHSPIQRSSLFAKENSGAAATPPTATAFTLLLRPRHEPFVETGRRSRTTCSRQAGRSCARRRRRRRCGRPHQSAIAATTRVLEGPTTCRPPPSGGQDGESSERPAQLRWVGHVASLPEPRFEVCGGTCRILL